jgi:ketosteroid isomerase-like protein
VRVLALPLLVAFALAACGGDDPEDIEAVIRGWAKASNERDAEAFCNDYVTLDFAERVSGATGDNAREQCEKLFAVTRPGLKVTILDVSEIEIEGDTASAVVRRQTTGTGPSDQLFRLKKEDGEFRISSSGEDTAN